jgi:GNAT superfamily N-acetyltransferase
MVRTDATSQSRIVRAKPKRTSVANVGQTNRLVLSKAHQQVELRRVTNTEFCDHLLRLSAVDRYLRFGQCMTDELIIAYTVKTLAADCFTFGVFDHFDARGVVELQLSTGQPAGLELGLTIEADWRRRGYGTCLIVHALAAARAMTSDTVFALINRSNTDMRMVAAKLGASMTERQGELYAEWTVARAAI